MAGPVGVERAEQPALGDHLVERPERAHSALLADEEARVDLAGGIVQGDHQVPDLARHPFVAGGVLVQQHPRQRPARALTPVRPAPRRRLDLAVRLQGQAKPVVAQPKAVLANQLLDQDTIPRRPPRAGPRPGPGAGRRDLPPPRPRSGPANAGRSAPTPPGSPTPRPGSARHGSCVRKPPRTSSTSVPVIRRIHSSTTLEEF